MNEMQAEKLQRDVETLSKLMADLTVKQHVQTAMLKRLLKDFMSRSEDRAEDERIMREIVSHDAQVASKRDLQPNKLQEQAIASLVDGTITKLLEG
ncbi:hypothetical protein FIV06_24045 [Labrenzia sp. THAF191b]|uniref:hypothetical protein n=1 Tax=Stappiaceae TaxID=2821832 RepID=UPI0012689879|nr:MULTISPECIES: hypothetical protein [Stappiaceae]QFT00522.1 hypothetical protein FIV06_24045 [Labrenzia sp. THAF191b]QFT06835.1 hypothetical protein FIV05_24040 [Labrenzia sp. THAF191a]QFT18379.1 hypothetical protein FIV03_24055 [Labrenzia sp. THAF187b]UES51604.1 hypothetical protein GFK88_19480 [Roseibium aggregatum]